MNRNLAVLYLAIGGLLGLAVGCGKTDNAPPQSPHATASPGEKTEPSRTTARPAEEPTNITAAAAPVALKATADAPVQPAVPAQSLPIKGAASGGVTNPPTVRSEGLVDQTKSSLAGLSQDQMVQGLQAALAKGLQQAIAKLGHDGGFLTNLSVRIPMPEKLQKVETALRAVKQDKLADDFVVTMNHAAEQAVPEAGSVFADALSHMTIEDAKSILNGPNDAATQYFHKTTQTNLYARFYPIIQKATAKTGVTAAYKNMLEKADVTKSLGSFGSALSGAVLDKDSLDVDAYVTNKSMDGLFKMVAEEEKQIRQNPVARTTDILQKVFGALKR